MNKPDIRFNGFNGEWVEKKINEISEINPHSELPVQFEYVDLESVTGTEMVSHRTERLESAPSRAQRLAQKGDIFYQTVRPYQKNNYYFNLNEKDYVFSTGYAQLRSKLDGNFFLSVLQSDKFVADVLENCTGTSYPAINPTTLGNLKVAFPDNAEQKKLGALFAQIDSLIASTQKEHDKLVSLKKCMLQKMFPKKGSLVPEIRFEGFSGDWVEKKAINIFKTINDRNYPELPVLSASQEYGMIYRDTTGINIHHDVANEVTYKRVLPGQFVIHLRSFQGGFAHSAVEGITSPAYTVMDFINKDENFDGFWKVIFMSIDFIKRLETITYGIRDGRSINFSEFSEMKFLAPSLPEQQKIGSYFQNLDNLISKQSAELEKLKNVKKTLLSKMFV